MVLAAVSIWYHIQISSNLAWVSSALSQGTVEDDGSDHLAIEGIKAILLITRYALPGQTRVGIMVLVEPD
jgi:hypothetical protein